MRSLFVCVVGLALGLGACGSVEPGGNNDVPAGPAVPASEGAAGCTHDGTGINATVTPALTGGNPVQCLIGTAIPDGLNGSVPVCFDSATQQPTAGAVLLTTMTFTIKDGVLQAPSSSSVQIVTQWFEWGSASATVCQAEVSAVVNVTAGSDPPCAAILEFGAYDDAPIGTYTVATP